MKGKVLLLFIGLFFTQSFIAQTWDPILIPNFQTDLNRIYKCNAVIFHDKLLVPIDSNLNNQTNYFVACYHNNSWTEFDLPVKPYWNHINQIQLKSWKDSLLLIGISFFDSTLMKYFTEIYTWDSRNFNLFSKYRIYYSGIADDQMFEINSSKLFYLTSSITGVLSDSVRLVMTDFSVYDTLYTILNPNASYFIGSTGDGVLIHGPSPTESENVYKVTNAGTFVRPTNFINVFPVATVAYPNGFLYASNDGFTGSATPKRRVIFWDNNNLQTPVGDDNFDKILNIKEIHGNIYASVQYQGVQEHDRLYLFDGANWSHYLPNQQFYYNKNGNNPSFPGSIGNMLEYEDYFYVIGTFDRIDNKPADGIARIPILNSVNLAPTAMDDVGFVRDTMTLEKIDIQSNDADPNDDYMHVEILSGPYVGTAEVSWDDEILYSPAYGFNGEDSLRYRACDVGGSCATAWLRITVEAAGSFPVAGPESYSILEDEVINDDLSLNDNHQGESVEYSVITDVVNGSLNLQNNGQFTYTPDSAFFGVDSFSVELCKSYGWCVSQTIHIDIALVNFGPVVGFDSLLILSPTSSIKPLDNDVDPDGEVLTATKIAGPFYPGANSFFNANGLNYVNGDYLSFGYDSVLIEVCDPHQVCEQYYVHFRQNFFPETNPNFQFVSSENTNVYPLLNDHEPDGDPWFLSVNSGPFEPGTLVSYCPGDSTCLVYHNPNWEQLEFDTIYYEVIDQYGYGSIDEIVLIGTSLSLDQLNPKEIRLFPNPTFGTLNIESPVIISLFQIQNALGQIVLEGQPNESLFEIDMSSWASGMYFVRLQSKQGILHKVVEKR